MICYTHVQGITRLIRSERKQDHIFVLTISHEISTPRVENLDKRNEKRSILYKLNIHIMWAQ